MVRRDAILHLEEGLVDGVLLACGVAVLWHGVCGGVRAGRQKLDGSL